MVGGEGGVHPGTGVVYRQVGDDTYLYRTLTGWYCGMNIGREDGQWVFLRNPSPAHQVPAHGWEYNETWLDSQPSTWVPAPTLTRETGPLPLCGVITVQGAGDADGEYHQVPGEYWWGRPEYRHAEHPRYELRVGWYEYVSMSM